MFNKRRHGRPRSLNRFRSKKRSNNSGGGRSFKSLPNDPSLFIKKSSSATSAEDYTPKNTFGSFNLPPVLLSNINKKGYTQPTPIQDQAITPILEGRDVIGLASTGSGKTAAFLIPLIQKIYFTKSQKALIIVPTRELALQIRDEFKSFAEGMGLYSALLIGGTKTRKQIKELQQNPHVVIATPGRLKDLVQRRVVHLPAFQNIVLDEVDLMVDIGFINDVKYFISLMSQTKQSLFFSATISPKVQGILQSFVRNPITISVKKQETSDNVDQDVVRVSNPAEKVDKLHQLLIQNGFSKVLVFGRTKRGVEKLHKELGVRGFKVGAIHGNKTQGHRQRILKSFRDNELQILLATDVASRGLDIDNVTHVINFDLPESYEDYVHRIGRTGRANQKGVALTFIT